MIGFVVIAFLAVAPLSLAAPSQVDQCVPTYVAPVYNEYDMQLIENGDFKVNFLGRINYTDSETGQEMYIPLKAKSFTLHPSIEKFGRYSLNVEFDCGTMQIDEFKKEDEPRSEALYSVYGFLPKHAINGADFLMIGVPPTSASWNVPVFEGTVLENESYWCYLPDRERAGRLYIQYMRVDNGAGRDKSS